MRSSAGRSAKTRRFREGRARPPAAPTGGDPTSPSDGLTPAGTAAWYLSIRASATNTVRACGSGARRGSGSKVAIMTQMTVEEFKRRQAAEERRRRRQADAFANYMITAIKADNCDALYRIGTSDEFSGGWRLFLHRISKGAIPEIGPEIKETFQQVWLERKSLALTIDSPRMLCRALRRLLPPYSGPAVVLYRGATLKGWRRGVSWTADIEVARSFLPKELSTIPNAPTPVIVETFAPPEAIICRIEYPAPFTEEEKAEMLKETPGCHFMEFHDEQEYIVDAERLTGFEIVEREREGGGVIA
jgi:hypothetical protein